MGETMLDALNAFKAKPSTQEAEKVLEAMQTQGLSEFQAAQEKERLQKEKAKFTSVGGLNKS